MTAFTALFQGTSPDDGTGTEARDAAQILEDNFNLAANKTENTSFQKMFGVSIISHVISSGAITVTNSYIKIDGEGGLDDDLDTINGTFAEGDILIIKRIPSVATTMTITELGNISLGSTTRLLSATRDRLMLQYDADASEFMEISYSDNG